MPSSILGRIYLIGAAASAIAFAPPAGAASDPGCAVGRSCSDASPAYTPAEADVFSTVPQGWSNEAQFVRPGYNPFGAGPQPPLLALE